MSSITGNRGYQIEMAEKVFKKLDEQLNCAICFDTYTDPKLLQCFHTYCTKCLINLEVRDRLGQLTLTCPACRQVTPIPPNGVRGLQSAFQINELIEIRDDLKKVKDLTTPDPETAVEGDATSQTDSKKISRFNNCSGHSDREHELYCETCNELICYKCVARDSKHHDHNYAPQDEAFSKYKGEIMSSLESMEKLLKTIHTALGQLNTRSKEISDQGMTVEASIHDTIRRLHETLNARKTELIGQLHQMIQRKLKYITTQRDRMETIQAQLSSSLKIATERQKAGSQVEILKMKTTIVNQVKELTIPDKIKPNTEADITFSTSADLLVQCQQYGKLLSIGLPDPLQCHATGKGLEVAVVGKMSPVAIQAVNYNGAPCDEPIQSLQCELVSDITCATVSGSLERRQSQYELSYQPTVKGRHQLHIEVEGHHIRGSPFHIAVKLPIKKLGTPILRISGVEGPSGITFNQRGKIMVAEYDRHCISIFSSSGEKLRSFGSRGSGQGQFNAPCGLALDGEGNILVVDSNNHRIQKFTSGGQLLTSVGTKGNGCLQFDHPNGITFNATNNMVYVVDAFNHRVQVLNSDLTFSSSFGEEGDGRGQFDLPQDIAYDSTGRVYVSDRDNHRIQVFTSRGKFLKMFGTRGYSTRELYQPISISIDARDRVYVGDLNSRISIFTPECQFLHSFGRRGNKPGEFEYTSGLAVDASGVVYVSDVENDCIQLF